MFWSACEKPVKKIQTIQQSNHNNHNNNGVTIIYSLYIAIKTAIE